MAIFKKQHDDDRPDRMPSPSIGHARSLRARNGSVVASTRVIRSRLSSADGLIIDGHLECTSAHHKKHLLLGEHARVKADIHASDVTVLGHLVGNIYSENMVALARGSDVTGDIVCANIVMETGARFTGNIDMCKPAKTPVAAEQTGRAEVVRS